jgi:hypothetical protein
LQIGHKTGDRILALQLQGNPIICGAKRKQSEQPLHEEKGLGTKNKGATACLGLLRPLKLSRKVLGLLALPGSADLPLGASRTSKQKPSSL